MTRTTTDVCAHMFELTAPILAGLDDTHRALEPAPGAKTAGWLVGHLAVSGDFARRMCGGNALCPPEWGRLFGPGSPVSTDPGDYPPMSLLVETCTRVYRDLCEIYPLTPAAHLETVNPYAPARDAFPTAGDFVAYLMTAHLGYHVGQLAGWRSAAGLSQV